MKSLDPTLCAPRQCSIETRAQSCSMTVRNQAVTFMLQDWAQVSVEHCTPAAAHICCSICIFLCGCVCVCLKCTSSALSAHSELSLKEGTLTASARGLRFNSFTLEMKWGQFFSISHQSTWITSVTWILWQVSSALIRQISVSNGSLGFLKWSKMLGKMLKVLEH